MQKALFPHHSWADADGRESPDPDLAKTGYFRNDPDAHSTNLRRCHQLLWSRQSPKGVELALHREGSGLLDVVHDVYLSSHAAVPVWERWAEVQSFLWETELRLRDCGRDSVHDLGWRLYDMGGFILFPAFQVGRRWTINQAKGCTRVRIADRLDLTLECIRLYYELLQSASASELTLPEGYRLMNPLGEVLHRYRSFFEIFGSFEAYVEFWLLDDLVVRGDDGLSVDFMLRRDWSGPYDFAKESGLPLNADEYLAYLVAADDFVARRNRRMAKEADRAGEEVCPACRDGGGGTHQRGW